MSPRPTPARPVILARYRTHEALRREGYGDDMTWLGAIRADWNLAVVYKLCQRYLHHWWKQGDQDLFGPTVRQCRICGITEVLP